MVSTQRKRGDDVRDEARRFVAEADRLARSLGREDLRSPLRAAELRLGDVVADVFVIGEYQKGKSAVVNALLGGAAVPSGPMLSTAVPIRIAHDAEPGLYETVAGAAGEEPTWHEVSGDDFVRFATTPVDRTAARARLVLDAYVAHPFLAEGILLVDCPPLGRGVSVSNQDVLLGADALVFVTDASQELTMSEVRFLTQARELCGHVVVVVNKIDLYPAWRRIVDLDRHHLERAGIDAPVVAVSAALHQQALVRGDADLARRSGVADLRAAVERHGLAELETSALTTAVDTLAATVAALRTPLQTELDALADRGAVAADATAETPVVADDVPWDRALARLLTEVRDTFVGDVERNVARMEEEALRTLQAEEPSRVWADLVDWLEAHASSDVASLVPRLARQLDEGAVALARRLEVRPPPSDALGHNRGVSVDRLHADRDDRSGGARAAVVGGALMGSSGVYTVLGLLNLANPLLLAALPVVGATAFAVDRYRDVRRNRRSQLERAYATEASRFVRTVEKESRAAASRLLGLAKDVYGAHFADEVARRDRTRRANAEARVQRLHETAEQRTQRKQRLQRTLSVLARLERQALALRPGPADGAGAGAGARERPSAPSAPSSRTAAPAVGGAPWS